MKRILSFVFLLLLSVNGFSQLSLKVYNYRPTGEFGFVMKPTFSAEVGWTQPFDDDMRWRSSFSASFLMMKPRMEVFPIYGTLTDGTGTHVLEGEQSFQKYNIAQLYCGFDLAIVKKEPFYAYAGVDITIGAASVEYTSKVVGVVDEGYSGGGILGGFRFRLGAEYDVNDVIGIMVNAERSVWLLSDPAAINWANYYGIGVKYQFD